jgi:tRNA (guanine37-N1)-methyltransferase
MTPRGYDYDQNAAKRLAVSGQDLIIICGRYEGYDERITSIVDEQICVGHYVLTGGEIAAMAVVDSIVRLIPGVLGGAQSAEIESFSDGDNREFPQYTRPENFKGLKVPEVLLSGNHSAIAEWRKNNSK